jgi:hypothetical protein
MVADRWQVAVKWQKMAKSNKKQAKKHEKSAKILGK